MRAAFEQCGQLLARRLEPHVEVAVAAHRRSRSVPRRCSGRSYSSRGSRFLLPRAGAALTVALALVRVGVLGVDGGRRRRGDRCGGRGAGAGGEPGGRRGGGGRGAHHLLEVHARPEEHVAESDEHDAAEIAQEVAVSTFSTEYLFILRD